jgi:branched-chain amino acid transport system ATP-binding protein
VEHHKIGELTRAFAETVRGVLLEFDISRDDILNAAKDFIENQNHHMEMERTVFFPAARQALSEADWAAIDATALERTDPLFNGGAAERYEALRQDIMRWKNEV